VLQKGGLQRGGRGGTRKKRRKGSRVSTEILGNEKGTTWVLIVKSGKGVINGRARVTATLNTFLKQTFCGSEGGGESAKEMLGDQGDNPVRSRRGDSCKKTPHSKHAKKVATPGKKPKPPRVS